MLLFNRPFPLLDKAGDDGGGGDPPKPLFSEEQLAAIGQTVNAAVTSHLKRQPALAEQLKGVDWKGLIGPVVTELIPKPDDSGSGGGSGDGGKAKGGKAASDDAVARQLQELATKLEASETARKEEARLRAESETNRKLDAAKLKLRSGLADKLAPGMTDIAIDHLTLVQGRLKVDEQGNALFRVKRAPYKGAPEADEDIALEEAIPVLLEEPGMKLFRAAPKPTGGGGPPGPRVPGSGGGGQPLSGDPATRTLQQFEALGIDPASLID
jgi:hypothetical protein